MTEQPDDDDPGGQPDWLDRHLPKLLIVGAAICALALVGRALTGE